jgi:ubiquinone/menaquinone biosynthesis C-methylase UbiE
MSIYELPFENKYNYAHSKKYYDKHQRLRKRLSTLVERWMAARALRMAGNPKTILDLPCGFGRFWPTLIASGATQIIAADKSAEMLQVAQEVNSSSILSHITCMSSTATEINLSDKSVDTILCMRLLHHISDKNYRQEIYNSFRRVARDTVVISLWSKKSIRYHKTSLPSDVDLREVNRHFFDPQEIESEFKENGFDIIGYTEACPYLSPWRTYVLKIK